MPESDHPRPEAGADRKRQPGRFDHLISVLDGVAYLVLPSPGRDLFELMEEFAQLPATVEWRSDPVVQRDRGRVTQEWTQWPWHLLKAFDPPRLSEPPPPPPWGQPESSSPGRRTEPLKPLSAAFMSAILGDDTQKIATHFRVDPATARQYVRRGREYWWALGAWPWRAVRNAASLPTLWWESRQIGRALTDWIVVTGLSTSTIASKFPEAALDDVCKRLGLEERLADAQQRNADDKRRQVDDAWARSGFARLSRSS